jgi:hypothetical protein
MGSAASEKVAGTYTFVQGSRICEKADTSA